MAHSRPQNWSAGDCSSQHSAPLLPQLSCMKNNQKKKKRSESASKIQPIIQEYNNTWELIHLQSIIINTINVHVRERERGNVGAGVSVVQTCIQVSVNRFVLGHLLGTKCYMNRGKAFSSHARYTSYRAREDGSCNSARGCKLISIFMFS